MKRICILGCLFIVLKGYSQELIERSFLRSYTIAELTNIVGVGMTYEVDLFKVTYKSIDAIGEPDTLSGLLAVPRTQGLVHPLLVYCHGTVDNREAVPSRLSGEHILAAAFAGLGYTTVAPDYVGLGDSRQKIHTYVHADSEASASFDMIKMARNHQENLDIQITDQLFLTGYSQGGHASMALHRFLEKEGGTEFEVTAASHMSGPYNISGDMIEFTLGEREFGFLSYLPHTFLSMRAAYPERFREFPTNAAFKEPYATHIDRFAKEEIGLFDMNELLRTDLQNEVGSLLARNMLQDSFLNDILNDNNSIVFQSLKDNDVYDWAPKANTRLMYCKGDDQVTFKNALTADSTMKANGSTSVLALNLGDELNHTQCVVPASTLTILTFNSFINILSSSEDAWVDKGIKLYPNPTTDRIFIADGQSSIGQLSIFDLSGRRIIFDDHSEGSIDVSNLQSGNYILLWRTDEYSFREMFFKQ